MHVHNIFRSHGNSKVQDTVFILKTLWQQPCYLDVFCYKAIAMSTSVYA